MTPLKLSVDKLKATGLPGLVLLLTGVCVLSMGAVAGFYHLALGRVARTAEESSAAVQEGLGSSYSLIESMSLTQDSVQILLREKDPDVLEKLVTDLETRQRDLALRIDSLGERGHAVQARFAAFQGASNHIVQTFLRGENAEANSELVNRLLPESDKVSAEVRKTNEINKREAAAQTEAMEREIVRIRNQASVAIGVAAAAVVAGGLSLARRVSRGTGAVAELLGRMTSLRAANELLEQSVRERTDDIERSNAQMAAIHRTSLDCVFVLDSQWRTIEFNPSAERAFRCSHDQAMGRNLREFVSAEPVDDTGSVVTGPAPFALGKQIEVTGTRLDGSTFPAEIAITAANMDGPPVYIASLRDLTERKKAEAEREELNSRLMSASRHAGMAEVATGVLHNVGNVLNSVNVSANVVAGKLRESELPSLARVSQMLRSRQQDLAAFLTNDERGKLVPNFIEDLAQCLGEEQRVMLDELSNLSKGIDHIKEIVSGQQSLAKQNTLLTAIEPAKLVETALTMQAGSLERHGIAIVRQFQSNEPVAVDAHKVLQILINLINNARQSVLAANGASRQITLAIERAAAGDQNRLRFKVIDTGTGIARENLTRIFSHGFTTKDDGHGFGLHSAANAATEMGGSLTVASEGAGLGATFTLEVPVTATKTGRSCSH